MWFTDWYRNRKICKMNQTDFDHRFPRLLLGADHHDETLGLSFQHIVLPTLADDMECVTELEVYMHLQMCRVLIARYPSLRHSMWIKTLAPLSFADIIQYRIVEQWNAYYGLFRNGGTPRSIPTLTQFAWQDIMNGISIECSKRGVTVNVSAVAISANFTLSPRSRIHLRAYTKEATGKPSFIRGQNDIPHYGFIDLASSCGLVGEWGNLD